MYVFIAPKQVARFSIRVQFFPLLCQDKETIIRVKYYLYQLSQELFENASCICTFFFDSLIVDKNYLDWVAQGT